MSWTALFILVTITIFLGWFVARFWLQLLILYYIIQIILVLLIASGMMTLTWFIMRGIMTGTADSEGWLQVWIFSLIFYVVVIAVYAIIWADILSTVRNFLNKFIK